MYKGLTAKTPGCVAFSLPVQRRNLRIQVPASFRSLHSQRSARLTRSGGFEPERCPVPGYHLVQGRLQTRHNRLSGPLKGSTYDGRRALRRRAGASAIDKAAPFAANCSDGPTLDAPDCVADHDPRNNRADAERKLRASFCSDGIPFGVATRVAFRPSPHPRIRWTVASPGGAIRAHGHTRPPPSRVPKCPTKC
jgi:hypothetical protein